MAVTKYLFTSSTSGEEFLTPILKDDLVIENIYISGQNGFKLYLVDTLLNVQFDLFSTSMTNYDLNIMLAEGQRLKVVTNTTSTENKILIQGKIY